MRIETSRSGWPSSAARAGLRQWTVAVTGMGPGAEDGRGIAVARCLREYGAFASRIVGFGKDPLDPGLHQREICDGGYLLPSPAEGAAALLRRIDGILAIERIDALIACRADEMENFVAIASELSRRRVRVMLPSQEQRRSLDAERLPALAPGPVLPLPPRRPAHGRNALPSPGWATAAVR